MPIGRDSNHPCPACNNPLRVIEDRGGLVLWCQSGKCDSKRAYCGVVTHTKEQTEEDALQILKQRIDDERKGL